MTESANRICRRKVRGLGQPDLSQSTMLVEKVLS